MLHFSKNYNDTTLWIKFKLDNAPISNWKLSDFSNKNEIIFNINKHIHYYNTRLFQMFSTIDDINDYLETVFTKYFAQSKYTYNYQLL
jgi:hypothetical protein